MSVPPARRSRTLQTTSEGQSSVPGKALQDGASPIFRHLTLEGAKSNKEMFDRCRLVRFAMTSLVNCATSESK